MLLIGGVGLQWCGYIIIGVITLLQSVLGILRKASVDCTHVLNTMDVLARIESVNIKGCSGIKLDNTIAIANEIPLMLPLMPPCFSFNYLLRGHKYHDKLHKYWHPWPTGDVSSVFHGVPDNVAVNECTVSSCWMLTLNVSLKHFTTGTIDLLL